MKNIKITHLFIFLAINLIPIFMIAAPCFGKEKLQEPTAIVVDADTGQPVEGAVAIAIWKTGGDNCAAFEGGCWKIANVIESVSDNQGRIYIKDFWKWHWSDYDKPWLTIYKFGYVCWSQQIIYLGLNNWKKRDDFNKDNRTVKLQVRPKEFSFVDHSSFISRSLEFLGGEDFTKNKLFLNELQKENPLLYEERDLRDSHKKQQSKGR